MNRDRFLRQRRHDWERFQALVLRLRGQRVRSWQGKDINELSRLYRSICYDLSIVQSREWGSQLEQYLNDLVAQGHNCLYRSPPRSWWKIINFMIDGFPRTLRKRKWFFNLALAMFAVPFVVSMIVAAMDPGLAELIVERGQLREMGVMYSDEMYADDNSQFADERMLMAGHYIQNNIGIAFKCFALGVFLGVGTALILLSNGIGLGTITGYIISEGRSDNFFSFVISHGSFELTAIVISGAAGLLVGRGMLHPGKRSRIDSLREHGIDAIKLAIGAGLMLVIAALVEAFWSPLPIPSVYKYVVGSFMWLIVILYFLICGRGPEPK